MEGTVICASRAEGLVARAGSAVKVAASGRGGMARGCAWEFVEGTLDAPALVLAAAVLAAGCLATGLALDAGAAFFAAALTGTGALWAGAFLAGVFAATLATGLAGAFLTGALAADLVVAGLVVLAAGFTVLCAVFSGAVLALAAGLPGLAPTLGWGFTSCLLAAAAPAWDCPASAVLPCSDGSPS